MATVDLTMSDSDVSVCGVPGSGAAPVEIVESEDEPLDQKKTKRVKYEGEMGAAAPARRTALRTTTARSTPTTTRRSDCLREP